MYLGIDFGTSSVKASVIDSACAEQWTYRVPLGSGDLLRPSAWVEALDDLFDALPLEIKRGLCSVAVDGTSGTVFLCDEALTPRSSVLAYDNADATAEAARIARACGEQALVTAPTSSLAKVLWLERYRSSDAACFIAHQADWIAARLRGEFSGSDEHNTLKLGFDPASWNWLPCITALEMRSRLPRVNASGSVLGPISASFARRHHFAQNCSVRAGTTDSMAAFLAAGATRAGDALTSLGSTLTLKLLSNVRIDAVDYGVYSHRFGDRWLLGGASNAGARVLSSFFTDQELKELSSCIEVDSPSALDYYPLLTRGERFPIADPQLEPRLAPRPASDKAFLHGLLEGLARIEQLGYERLESLGAPAVTRVFTSGGGAHNPAWAAIRRRVLAREIAAAPHTEAAYGAALLARLGTNAYKAARMEDTELP